MIRLLRAVDRYRVYGLILLYAAYCVMEFLFKRSDDLSHVIACLCTLLVMVFAYFGTYFVLWVQLKNPSCSRRLLLFFTRFFLIVMLLTLSLMTVGVVMQWQGTDSLIILLCLLSSISSCIRFLVRNKEAIQLKP